jgi:murein L,D-transpeptidase YafK
MKHVIKAVLAVVLIVGLTGCASKFRSYRGPEVTRVIVLKQSRLLYLMHNDSVLKSYQIGLGFAPQGHKQVSGDGKTPEGEYTIDRRNPDSDYHLSIGIDYPNERDIEEARKLGKDPGGDIFIHGQGNGYTLLRRDWTWGCIAVTNDEIEEIYAMVRDGTPISIYK